MRARRQLGVPPSPATLAGNRQRNAIANRLRRLTRRAVEPSRSTDPHPDVEPIEQRAREPLTVSVDRTR
jgi:hypothetical protein